MECHCFQVVATWTGDGPLVRSRHQSGLINVPDHGVLCAPFPKILYRASGLHPRNNWPNRFWRLRVLLGFGSVQDQASLPRVFPDLSGRVVTGFETALFPKKFDC